VQRRWLNRYGDPNPWSVQATPVLTAISFSNCTKYPPSLMYLLMTRGPAILTLGLIDNVRARPGNSFAVFGRVPLFYYVLHLPVIHTLALVLAQVRYGRMGFMLEEPPGDWGVFPPGYGYSLWVVYLIWASVVFSLYPVCRRSDKKRSAFR
jgi:hypothetical protein